MLRLSRVPVLLAAVVLTTGALTAGCGGGDGDGDKPKAGSTSTPTSSAPPTASREPSQLIKVTKYDVSFRIPKSWTALDSKKLRDMMSDGQSSDLAAMAQRLGMTQEQFANMFGSNVQNFAISTDGAIDGFVANLNVLALPDQDATDADIETGLAAAGAKVLDIEHPDLGHGKLLRVRYVLNLPNGKGKVQGSSIGIITDGTLVQITVSSRDRDEADRLGDQIATSVQAG